MTVLGIFLTATAVCYGWGVRGCIIGGEKGAMFPGLLLGAFVALFSGEPVFREYWYVFAAVGACCMFRGGTEPYAETLDWLRRRNRHRDRVKTGYTGTFLKGALWFGIAGIGLGMTAGALTYYKHYTKIMFLAIPFVQAIGTSVFNHPYDRKAGIRPKLYFSEDSREEWGGSVLQLLLLVLIASLNADWFALLTGFAGVLAGGCGFVIGIKADDRCSIPFKNGKYVFGKLMTSHRIDTWKIMEHVFGFIGGTGVAVAFALQKNAWHDCAVMMENNGIASVFSARTDTVLGWIAFAGVLMAALQYGVKFLLRKKDKTVPDDHVFELIERPMYETVPLFLVMTGNLFAAKVSVGFILLWVLGEKFFGDLYERYYKPLPIVLLGIATAGVGVVCMLVCADNAKVMLPVLLWMYTGLCALHMFPTKQMPKTLGCIPTVLGHFIIETAALSAAVILQY